MERVSSSAAQCHVRGCADACNATRRRSPAALSGACFLQSTDVFEAKAWLAEMLRVFTLSRSFARALRTCQQCRCELFWTCSGSFCGSDEMKVSANLSFTALSFVRYNWQSLFTKTPPPTERAPHHSTSPIDICAVYSARGKHRLQFRRAASRSSLKFRRQTPQRLQCTARWVGTLRGKQCIFAAE